MTKRVYQEPAMRIVKLKHKNQLLGGSPTMPGSVTSERTSYGEVETLEWE